ncbi:IS481 family transposase [Schlegelella sp. S2-27]|uniref:IS481 family transposase n=2 Tax=Caldimonas mangrovi TaxID=2944811 RepID=A0ABT0YW70_9BURK|nr:IS481 family transposase [Caldimonas mangrovi]MCM5683003.1 IS481 family transposase [Caldimonas mangrovi]
MNTHKNARLTFLRRLEMVEDITKRGLSASEAAEAHGVSAVTARKWLGRYLVGGATGLADKSSRPARSPRAIDPSVGLAVVELRRKLFTQSRIATYLGVSKATVSRVLRRAGLSKFSNLAPLDAVQRYERDAPGELLHIDIKKLGKFSDIGHRITGDYTKRTRGLGYEYLFVAVDDHARVAFTAMRPDERKGSAESFLREATAYFAKLGVSVQRVLTDNGPAFHSFSFRDACVELGIQQKFTRAYRPQTNGKAERFIQSALREWAYGRPYATSEARRIALPVWNHFYNWHRPHHGIGCLPPMSRIKKSRKNLLTLHT